LKESNATAALQSIMAADSRPFALPADRILAEYEPEKNLVRLLGDRSIDQAVVDVFPRLSELGQLTTKELYYTVIRCALNQVAPAAVQLLEIGSKKYLQADLLTTEAAWLQRRQYLMTRLAARSWHYIANLSTAGMGYLAYLQTMPENSNSKEVLAGVDKSFRRVQDSARLVCDLVRHYDGAREQPFFKLALMMVRFAEGLFLPDFQIEWTQEQENNGIAVKEIALAHLLLELFLMTYEQGCRRLKVQAQGEQGLVVSLDRAILQEQTVTWTILSCLAQKFEVQIFFRTEFELHLALG
jgi:hypothetical protein